MSDRQRCGVLGDPIAHSLSPVLHRAGYAALGIEWTYDAHQVTAGGLAGFLDGLDGCWRGLSLTMPLKREAAASMDRVTDRARLAGAINTVVIDTGLLGTERVGDNTDLPGAIAAIRERTDADLRAGVILGGGATATSIGLGLIELGARSVRLLVRDSTRAEQTRQALSAHPSSPDITVGDLDGTEELWADIVVSTIPGQAQTDELVRRCASVPIVFEALYDPWPTPLAQSVGARTAAGRTLVGGLDLLVHQAALQFELFTGRTVPVDVMRAAGQQALDKRTRS